MTVPHAEGADFLSWQKVQTSKNHHGESNCIKKHDEIDNFSSKFDQKLNNENLHAEGNCIKKHAKIDGKKQANDLFACLSIRRHAEANCIEKHVKIDTFSLKFEQKLKHEKSSRRR